MPNTLEAWHSTIKALHTGDTMTTTTTTTTDTTTNTGDTMTTTQTTPKPATTTRVPVRAPKPVASLFAGKTDEQITNALRSMADKINSDIETFGAMLVEAYARQVHESMGYDSWAEYCEDTLGAFKPTTPARKFLASLMRESNMPNADIAAATRTSERTVIRDSKEAGHVSDTMSKSRSDAAKARAANAAVSSGEGKDTSPAKSEPNTLVPNGKQVEAVVKYLAQHTDTLSDDVLYTLVSGLNRAQRIKVATWLKAEAGIK